MTLCAVRASKDGGVVAGGGISVISYITFDLDKVTKSISTNM
jgi:hypothetical protein